MGAYYKKEKKGKRKSPPFSFQSVSININNERIEEGREEEEEEEWKETWPQISRAFNYFPSQLEKALSISVLAGN